MERRNPVNFLSSILPFWLLRLWMPRRFIVYGHLIYGANHAVSQYYRYPTLAEFDAFVKWMRRLGYDFVTLEEYRVSDSRKKILLTFDDGFRVIYDTLHPYMKQHGLPYVLFVLTNPLSDQGFYIKTIKPAAGFETDRMFLNAEEILALKNDGVHIGFHTRSHRKIEATDGIDDAAVQQELTIPGEFASLFSKPLSFAYPYLAPANYAVFDAFMRDKLGYTCFFDTNGLHRDGDHYFRVGIDAERSLTGNNWLLFTMKRQLLLFVSKRVKSFIKGNRIEL